MQPGLDTPERPVGWSTRLFLLSVLVVLGEAVIGYPAWLRDTIRTVDLVLGVFIVTTSLAIGRRYGRNFRQDPSKARLLPRHVVRLALGVVVLTVASCAVTLAVLGGPFVWYATPLVLPAFVLLATGLWDMIEWLPERTVAPGSVSNVNFHHAVQDMEVKQRGS